MRRFKVGEHCELETCSLVGFAQDESGYEIRPTLETRIRAETRIPLIKIAAECHRRKWQFNIDDEAPLMKAAEARRLVNAAFYALHNVGDTAHKAAEALRKPETDSLTPAGSERPPGTALDEVYIAKLKAERDHALSLVESARAQALREAEKAIENLRHLAATDFTISGQRASDRCDAFFDAYQAIGKLSVPSTVGEPK
jgi:hypothetical protein